MSSFESGLDDLMLTLTVCVISDFVLDVVAKNILHLKFLYNLAISEKNFGLLQFCFFYISVTLVNRPIV